MIKVVDKRDDKIVQKVTKPMTNLDIAREFCAASVQRTFGLSDERTEEYAKIIAELLDFAVENALEKLPTK